MSWEWQGDLSNSLNDCQVRRSHSLASNAIRTGDMHSYGNCSATSFSFLTCLLSMHFLQVSRGDVLVVEIHYSSLPRAHCLNDFSYLSRCLSESEQASDSV